jgi:transposase
MQALSFKSKTTWHSYASGGDQRGVSEEEIAKALAGTWRPEHVFALKQAYELYQFHHRQIGECDTRLRDELAKLPIRSGAKPITRKPRTRGRKSNDVRFDACGPLFRALGVDLTEIEGIDVGTTLVILAEIGVDVSKFPTEKQFASWLGLCPSTHKSNKTQKKRGPRKGKNRVALALRLAARALVRTRSPLALFYQRIKSRIGAAGAITATAHKLARLVYRMLKYGRDYVKQDMREYAAKQKEKLEQSLRKKAAALGYELVPRATPICESVLAAPSQ